MTERESSPRAEVDVEGLEALLAKASPPPWSACDCGKCGLVWSETLDYSIGSTSGRPARSCLDTGPIDDMPAPNMTNDAALVAAAVTALPSLLAEIRALRRVAEAVRAWGVARREAGSDGMPEIGEDGLNDEDLNDARACNEVARIADALSAPAAKGG